MSGYFILEFPSMKSPILALMHARASKVIVGSIFRSHEPYIKIHEAYGP